MELFDKASLLFEDQAYIDIVLVYENDSFVLELPDGTSSNEQDEAGMLQILETIQAFFDDMSSQQTLDYVRDIGRATLAVRPKNLFKAINYFQ